MSAAGKRPISRSIDAREGEALTFEVPPLADDVTATAATTQPSPTAGPVHSENAAIAHDESPEKRSIAVPLVLAGLGLVGVGVGSTFALLARSQNEESKDDCTPGAPNQCGAHGVELRNSAIRKGNVATVAFIAGGASLVGAGLVWLLGGSSSETRESKLSAEAQVGPGAAAMYLNGRF